jgi:hypothetical protein
MLNNPLVYGLPLNRKRPPGRLGVLENLHVLVAANNPN